MFMFSKKATKIDKIFTVDLTFVVSVQSTVKISAIFVAFLENTNFKDKKILPENSHHSISHFLKQTEICSPTQNTMVGISVFWSKIIWHFCIPMPYPCSHFYIAIKFGNRLYSKKKRRVWPLLC